VHRLFATKHGQALSAASWVRHRSVCGACREGRCRLGLPGDTRDRWVQLFLKDLVQHFALTACTPGGCVGWFARETSNMDKLSLLLLCNIACCGTTEVCYAEGSALLPLVLTSICRLLRNLLS
jgi:hypothetical protein